MGPLAIRPSGLVDLQGFQARIEAGFLPRGLILVDDALARHAVENGCGLLVCGGGTFLISGGDGLENLLARGPHCGPLTGILIAVLLGLPGPLSGLC